MLIYCLGDQVIVVVWFWFQSVLCYEVDLDGCFLLISEILNVVQCFVGFGFNCYGKYLGFVWIEFVCWQVFGEGLVVGDFDFGIFVVVGQ